MNDSPVFGIMDRKNKVGKSDGIGWRHWELAQSTPTEAARAAYMIDINGGASYATWAASARGLHLRRQGIKSSQKTPTKEPSTNN